MCRNKYMYKYVPRQQTCLSTYFLTCHICVFTFMTRLMRDMFQHMCVIFMTRYVSRLWVWLLFDTPHQTFHTTHRICILQQGAAKGYVLTWLFDMCLVREYDFCLTPLISHILHDSSCLHFITRSSEGLRAYVTHGCVPRSWHDSCGAWLIIYLQHGAAKGYMPI